MRTLLGESRIAIASDLTAKDSATATSAVGAARVPNDSYLDQSQVSRSSHAVIGILRLPVKVGFPEGQTSKDKVPEAAQITISSIIANVGELGLKLEAKKGSAAYIVVDHAEKPDAN